MSSMYSSAPQQNRLSFGVEFEFALLVLHNNQEDPDPQDHRPVRGIDRYQPASDEAEEKEEEEEEEDEDSRSHVSNETSSLEMRNAHSSIKHTLLSNGIPVLTEADIKYNEIPHGTHKLDYWHVTEDSSIGVPAHLRGKYIYHQIEVKSPAYLSSEEALEAVQKVCCILTHSYRIVTDESCGLHVHVGTGVPALGFETDVVRKLIATLWTFAPQLDKIHPMHRRRNDSFCPPIGKYSKLAETNSGLSRMEALSEILHAHTIDELYDLVGGVDDDDGIRVDKMACNIANLSSDNDSLEQLTVEFRQHEGTLDPERVAMWIRSCVGLLEFSETVNEANLIPFLEENIDSSVGVMNIAVVLDALRMPAQGLFYSLRQAK